MKKLLMMTVMLGAFAAPVILAPAVHANEKKGEMWFSKVDTNGDGVISKAEHEKASANKFAKMDTNNDGKVTKEEVRAAKEKWKEEKKAQ